ncbi:MAG: hypothetical protein AAF631_01915 [Pseudomonadota bacterium]
MRYVIAPILVFLLAMPASAQDDSAPDRFADLFKKLEELGGEARNLMEDWADEIGPRLEELGPLFDDLASKIGDMSAYHAPEVLENGDIIIRRKRAEDIPTEKPPADDAIIDL